MLETAIVFQNTMIMAQIQNSLVFLGVVSALHISQPTATRQGVEEAALETPMLVTKPINPTHMTQRHPTRIPSGRNQQVTGEAVVVTRRIMKTPTIMVRTRGSNHIEEGKPSDSMVVIVLVFKYWLW